MKICDNRCTNVESDKKLSKNLSSVLNFETVRSTFIKHQKDEMTK